MDSKDFLLKRRELLDRLETRRARDISTYPFRLGGAFGLKFPAWMRWLLTLVPVGGLAGGLMRVALPIALPFIFRKQPPLLDRLFACFLPSKR